jgi:hypothetical protein
MTARIQTSRPQSLGMVLACGSCQWVYEPTEGDFGRGNTGCPKCGGWTMVAELVEPRRPR